MFLARESDIQEWCLQPCLIFPVDGSHSYVNYIHSLDGSERSFQLQELPQDWMGHRGRVSSYCISVSESDPLNNTSQMCHVLSSHSLPCITLSALFPETTVEGRDHYSYFTCEQKGSERRDLPKIIQLIRGEARLLNLSPELVHGHLKD